MIGSMPETLEVLCAREMDRRMVEESMAMPARKSKNKTRPVPVMPLLPKRPYIETSSRGGGDISKIFPLPLAMVAQLIPGDKIDTTEGGRDAVLSEWYNLEKRNCWNVGNAEEWDVVKSESRQSRSNRSLGIYDGVVVSQRIRIARGR